MCRTLCISAAALMVVATTLGAQGGPDSTSTQRRDPGAKSPTTARLIGIVPGAGHMYAGETGRGLAYLGGMVGILVIGGALAATDCVASLLGQYDEPCPTGNAIANVTNVVALGLWGWTIYDAGRAARRTNASRGLRTSLIITPIGPPSPGTARSPGLTLGLSFATR